MSDIAVVTGGGRGIGRHIAVGLAEAGAEVAVVSRKQEACESVASEIEAAGGRARAYATDCADPAAIDDLVDRVGAFCRGVYRTHFQRANHS